MALPSFGRGPAPGEESEALKRLVEEEALKMRSSMGLFSKSVVAGAKDQIKANREVLNEFRRLLKIINSNRDMFSGRRGFEDEDIRRNNRLANRLNIIDKISGGRLLKNDIVQGIIDGLKENNPSLERKIDRVAGTRFERSMFNNTRRAVELLERNVNYSKKIYKVLSEGATPSGSRRLLNRESTRPERLDRRGGTEAATESRRSVLGRLFGFGARATLLATGAATAGLNPLTGLLAALINPRLFLSVGKFAAIAAGIISITGAIAGLAVAAFGIGLKNLAEAAILMPQAVENMNRVSPEEVQRMGLLFGELTRAFITDREGNTQFWATLGSAIALALTPVQKLKDLGELMVAFSGLQLNPERINQVAQGINATLDSISLTGAIASNFVNNTNIRGLGDSLVYMSNLNGLNPERIRMFAESMNALIVPVAGLGAASIVDGIGRLTGGSLERLATSLRDMGEVALNEDKIINNIRTIQRAFTIMAGGERGEGITGYSFVDGVLGRGQTAIDSLLTGITGLGGILLRFSDVSGQLERMSNANINLDNLRRQSEALQIIAPGLALFGGASAIAGIGQGIRAFSDLLAAGATFTTTLGGTLDSPFNRFITDMERFSKLSVRDITAVSAAIGGQTLIQNLRSFSDIFSGLTQGFNAIVDFFAGDRNRMFDPDRLTRVNDVLGLVNSSFEKLFTVTFNNDATTKLREVADVFERMERSLVKIKETLFSLNSSTGAENVPTLMRRFQAYSDAYSRLPQSTRDILENISRINAAPNITVVAPSTGGTTTMNNTSVQQNNIVPPISPRAMGAEQSIWNYNGR